MGRICASILLLISWLPAPAVADPCLMETSREVDLVRGLIQANTLIVYYCWYCESAEPLPLRVQSLEIRHTEPEQVQVIAWAENPPQKKLFPVAALVQAERSNTGPLAAFIRQDVERSNSDTSGYLGPNDPYLVQEKRAQVAMQLEHVRQDHEMRSWDELYVNNTPADPRLLYVAAGGNKFESVGHRVGCTMDDAPRSVTFRPVPRDPARAAPPEPFVADITGQCYDGACPQDVWRVIRQVKLLERPSDDANQVAALEPNEDLVPLRIESHVIGSRAIVTRDHEKFFKDDVVYVLDSQAEGLFRVWHYGDVFVIDATGIRLGSGWDLCESTEGGCWARGALPPTTWWAEVRRSNGTTGWVKNPIESLDGVLRSD